MDQKMPKDAVKAVNDYVSLYQMYIDHADLIAPNARLELFNPGWHSIVTKFFARAKELNYPIKVVQIKEKFGSLRIYYDVLVDSIEDYDRQLNDILYETENVCDICGDHGTLGGKGYIACRCESHRNYRMSDEANHALHESMTNSGLDAKQRLASAQYAARDYKTALFAAREDIRRLRDELGSAREHDEDQTRL